MIPGTDAPNLSVMSASHLLLFAATELLSSLTPGPAVLLVVSLGVAARAGSYGSFTSFKANVWRTTFFAVFISTFSFQSAFGGPPQAVNTVMP